MKKIKVIARQNIGTPDLNHIHGDVGRYALNGIFESKIYTVEDNYEPNVIMNQFEEDCPDYQYGKYEIRDVE